MNRTLLYDGSGASILYAPVKPSISNFSVIAKIRRGDYPPNDPSLGLGVIAHGWISGGVIRDCCDSNFPFRAGIHIGQVTSTQLDPADMLASSDFDPGSQWHSYKLQVHGNRYSLFVDGALGARGRNNANLSDHRVGIFSSSIQIEVKVFKVTTP